MTNPFQSIPNAGDFQDPLGFIKKLWGDVQIPGMVTPTVSVEELDQKIKDLKAVESWLTLNMNMLRGSIQALEVQRSTIVALQEMGKSFAKNVTMPARTDFSTATSTTKNTDHVKEEVTPQATSAFDYAKNADIDTNKVTEEETDKVSETNLKADSVTNSANVSPAWAMPAEAHTWWNVVQDQFKQALSKVMVSDEHNATEENKTDDKKADVKPKTKTKIQPKKATSQSQKIAPKKATIKKTSAVNVVTKVASKVTSKAAKKPTLKDKASIAKKQNKTE